MIKRLLVTILLILVLLQLYSAGPVACGQRGNVLDIDEQFEVLEKIEDEDETPLELLNEINHAYANAQKKLRSGKITDQEIHGTLSFQDLELLELTAGEKTMEEIKKEYEAEYAKIPASQTTALKTYPELWEKAVSEMQKRGVILSIKRFLMWEEHKKHVLQRMVTKYKGKIPDAEIVKKYSDLLATYNNIVTNSNVKVIAYQTFHANCVNYFYNGAGKAYHDALVKVFTERKFDEEKLKNAVGYNVYIQCTYLFNKQWATKLKEAIDQRAKVTDGCADKQVCEYDCKHLSNLDCSKATEPTTGFMDLTERIKLNGNESTAYNYACKTGLFVAKPTASDADLQAQFQANVEKVTKLTFADMIKERPYVTRFLGHIDYQYLDWIQNRNGDKATKVQIEIVASLINFKDGLRGFAKLCRRNPEYMKFDNLALVYNQYLTDAEEHAFNPATTRIESTDPFALAYFRQRIWRSRWALGEYTIQQYLDAYNYFQGFSNLILLDFIYQLQFNTVDESQRAYCSCDNYGTFYSYFTQNPSQMASYRVHDLSFYPTYAKTFAQKCLTICKLKQPSVEKKTEVIVKPDEKKQTEKVGTEKDQKKEKEELIKSGKNNKVVEKPKEGEEPKKNEKLEKLEKEKRKQLEKETKKDEKHKPVVVTKEESKKNVEKAKKVVFAKTKPKKKVLPKEDDVEDDEDKPDHWDITNIVKQ